MEQGGRGTTEGRKFQGPLALSEEGMEQEGRGTREGRKVQGPLALRQTKNSEQV